MTIDLQELQEICVRRAGETPEDCRATFIQHIQPTSVARLKFRIGDVVSEISYFGNDPHQIEMKIRLFPQEDSDPVIDPHDILHKDVSRVGRSILTALEQRGYKISGHEPQFSEHEKILTSNTCTVYIPDNKTAEDLYSDLTEAHIAANTFMKTFFTHVRNAEKETIRTTGLPAL